MSKSSNGFSLTLLGLIIAGLGVISPIAWDWWSNRIQLLVEIKSSISIVSVSQTVNKLELLYDGKRISELRKAILIVRNSGKTPITHSDVVSPLTLKFSDGDLLEATIAKKRPSKSRCNRHTVWKLTKY